MGWVPLESEAWVPKLQQDSQAPGASCLSLTCTCHINATHRRDKKMEPRVLQMCREVWGLYCSRWV